MTLPLAPLYLEAPSSQGQPTKTCAQKTCASNGDAQPLSNFSNNRNEPDGLDEWCKACRNAYVKAWLTIRREKLKLNPLLGDDGGKLRTCRICILPFPLADFPTNPGSKNGRSWDCASCTKKRSDEYRIKNLERILAKGRNNPRGKELMKIWKQNNPARVKALAKSWYEENKEYALTTRKNHWFKGYGVGREWYDKVLAEQGGGCAICGTKTSGGNGRFHIDHDHSCCTKPCTACDNCRRGLLCNRCNLKLGLIEDEKWREKALAYLAKHRKPAQVAGVEAVNNPSVKVIDPFEPPVVNLAVVIVTEMPEAGSCPAVICPVSAESAGT